MAAKRNAFNLTLSAKHAAALQARAGDVGLPPTTLAARLLEEVLDGRDAALVQGELNSLRESLDEVSSGVAAAFKEAAMTRRDLANLARKLLAQSGMTPEQANAWVVKYLHPPVEGRRGA